MNQKQKETLKLEEDFIKKVEEELKIGQKENKQISITDIKLVGKVSWKDKINGKMISENVFIVEKEIKENDKNGNERKTKQEKIYLGEKAIAGRIGTNEIIYKSSFENINSDKYIAVKNLLENISEKELEKYSFNTLNKIQIMEVLSAHLGKKVTEKELEKILEEMETVETEKEQEVKKDKEDKEKSKNQLSKKQSEKIKVNAIQKADLNISVDGQQTLGKRLDLQEYDNLYIIYSEKVNEINPEAKRNNTTYSLVGMTKAGEAKVLNDEFEMDRSVGNSASKKSTKIRNNNTATRDNKDLSVYTRKSNGISIGCENNKGTVGLSLYQKTKEENENVGIPIQTSNIGTISTDIKNLGRKSKGIQNIDDIQDEVENHIENGCELNRIEDFDGNKDTSSHKHFD